MRKSMLLAAAVLLLWPAANQCLAGVDIGLSVDEDGVKGFYLAIGEHYQVPEKQVVVVRERNVPDEELPVVFFLAKRAGVDPSVIVKLRLGGSSWMQITAHFGLTAEIYYVNFDRDPGPPYGKAWGHYKNRQRNEWGKISLTDADVVNFVNLKFISEKYGYSPQEVVKMRAQGDNFVNINKKVKANKGQEKKKEKAMATTDKPKTKGNGKGKNK